LARFGLSEIPEKYAYTEDGTEMKEFILGEQKEVGVELSTTDGTDFGIESAPYVYKDSAGTVLGSGEATIDGKKVYVLLAPTVAGYSHKVIFTITTQPLDANGQPEINRNKEVIKATVIIDVLE
jgi:hypothetical protein